MSRSAFRDADAVDLVERFCRAVQKAGTAATLRDSGISKATLYRYFDVETGRPKPGWKAVTPGTAERMRAWIDRMDLSRRSRRSGIIADAAYAVAEALEEPAEARTRFARSGTLVAAMNDLHDRERADLDELEGLAGRVMQREQFSEEEREDIAEWLDASRKKAARHVKVVSTAEDNSRA